MSDEPSTPAPISARRAHRREASVIDPLGIVALEVERHVAEGGWDQPIRLFALAPSLDLVKHEPQLAATLGLGPSHHEDLLPGQLTAIEQEGMPAGSNLESLLGRLAWPEEVQGVALAIERMVVPPDAERDLPADAERALEHLAGHPDRRDVRLVVAVSRNGGAICLLRQRDHDADDQVASSPDIAPGLVEALRETLRA